MNARKDIRRIIWTAFPEFKDWEEYLREEYPDLDEDELYYKMLDLNGEYLDDERVNLNIQLHDEILVIADIGRWNGRFSGYGTIKSGNIRDCLYSEYDPEWYVDQNYDLRCDAHHHDGVNHYLYRVWKPGISDFRKEKLLNKIYEGIATRTDVTSATEKIGTHIANVYGWSKICRPKKREFKVGEIVHVQGNSNDFWIDEFKNIPVDSNAIVLQERERGKRKILLRIFHIGDQYDANVYVREKGLKLVGAPG